MDARDLQPFWEVGFPVLPSLKACTRANLGRRISAQRESAKPTFWPSTGLELPFSHASRLRAPPVRLTSMRYLYFARSTTCGSLIRGWTAWPRHPAHSLLCGGSMPNSAHVNLIPELLCGVTRSHRACPTLARLPSLPPKCSGTAVAHMILARHSILCNCSGG